MALKPISPRGKVSKCQGQLTQFTGSMSWEEKSRHHVWTIRVRGSSLSPDVAKCWLVRELMLGIRSAAERLCRHVYRNEAITDKIPESAAILPRFPSHHPNPPDHLLSKSEASQRFGQRFRQINPSLGEPVPLCQTIVRCQGFNLKKNLLNRSISTVFHAIQNRAISR